jgi:hypothetical protein
MAVCGYALSDNILLVQFQLHLSNHFWMIHPRTLRQYSGQKNSTWKGSNFPRGAPGMLELHKVFWKLRIWGLKRSEKYFEPPIIAKIILERFSQKMSPQPPPPFPTFTFYWKIFAYQKIFWGGPRKGRGPNFLSSSSTHPPTRYRLARPNGNTLFITGIFQNSDKELSLNI